MTRQVCRYWERGVSALTVGGFALFLFYVLLQLAGENVQQLDVSIGRLTSGSLGFGGVISETAAKVRPWQGFVAVVVSRGR